MQYTNGKRTIEASTAMLERLRKAGYKPVTDEPEAAQAVAEAEAEVAKEEAEAAELVEAEAAATEAKQEAKAAAGSAKRKK